MLIISFFSFIFHLTIIVSFHFSYSLLYFQCFKTYFIYFFCFWLIYFHLSSDTGSSSAVVFFVGSHPFGTWVITQRQPTKLWQCVLFQRAPWRRSCCYNWRLKWHDYMPTLFIPNQPPPLLWIRSNIQKLALNFFKLFAQMSAYTEASD